MTGTKKKYLKCLEDIIVIDSRRSFRFFLYTLMKLNIVGWEQVDELTSFYLQDSQKTAAELYADTYKA